MRKIIVWTVLLVFCMNLVYGGSEVVSVTLLGQDPDPAGAGEVTKLRFNVANLGDSVIDGLEVELLPKYPFSKMNGEEYVKVIPQLSGYPYTAKYQVLVDRDALEATNEIDVRYRIGPEGSWGRKTFEIDVDDIQTGFDLVVQEIAGDEVSVAIANIGNNVAYSTIVRVPEQDSYETTGTSGQMIGNLDDGDYTLVTFQITKKRGASADDPLKFRIDYTDEIGERRTEIKEVPFELGGSASALPQGTDFEAMRAARQGQLQQTKFYQQWWFWGVIIVAAFIGWKAYKKHKKKK